MKKMKKTKKTTAKNPSQKPAKTKRTANLAAPAVAPKRKARATIIKKVIQSTDAQTLRTLAESVTATQLDADKVFYSALEHLRPEVRDGAKAIVTEYGLSAVAAGRLAIRLAALEARTARDGAPAKKKGRGPWMAQIDASNVTSMPGTETVAADVTDGVEQLASA